MQRSHRRIRGCALLCLLLTALLMMVAFGAVAEEMEGKITGGKLHLREEPTLDSRTIATYKSDTTVEITGEENGFFQVTMPDGQSGYMEAKYIAADPTYVTGDAVQAGQVIGGELHLREDPSETGVILATYDAGTKVKVLGEEGDFYWVSLSDGKTGYMEKEYIHVPSADTSYTGVAGRVIATGTNLRTEPSTGSDSLGEYMSGAPLEIDSKSGDFYHVTMEDGRSGYMEADYVYAYDTETPTHSLYRTGVLRSELNLREAPSLLSADMGSYPRGTKVQILNEKDGFFHVYLHDGNIGYMEADYIDMEDNTDDSNG